VQLLADDQPPQFTSIFWMYVSGRMIGKPGKHRDVVPSLHPQS